MKQLTKDHFTKLLTAITEQHEKNRRVMEGLYQAFPTANPASLMPDISVIEISVATVLQELVGDDDGIINMYINASLTDVLPIKIHIGRGVFPLEIGTPNELWDAIEEIKRYYA